jgi:hypothetical protein
MLLLGQPEHHRDRVAGYFHQFGNPAIPDYGEGHLDGVSGIRAPADQKAGKGVLAVASETGFDEDPPREIIFEAERQFQTISFLVLIPPRPQAGSLSIRQKAPNA